MSIKAMTYLLAAIVVICCICGFTIKTDGNVTQVTANMIDGYEGELSTSNLYSSTEFKLTEDTETEALTSSYKSEPKVSRISHTASSETTRNEETKTTVQPKSKEGYLGKFKLTAYCSCDKCCGQYALNRPKDKNGNEIVYGASGRALYQNYSIAVDPNIIPYGSHVNINGHEYEAADCGGAIKGDRIDVYFASHQDASDFGVQYADVYLVKE